MNWDDYYLLKKEKKKNNKIKSEFIHLYKNNRHREKALVTFTTTSLEPEEQLALMVEIKRYFAKRLNNLNAKVKYFSVIEIGGDLNNPHIHCQLYFDEETKTKIIKAFNKTLEEFNLDETRCVLTLDNKKTKIKSSINYCIKEFDTRNLSDDDILALARSRMALKEGRNRNVQFYSRSRLFQPMTIYRTLYKKFDLSYAAVDNLFKIKLLSKISRTELPRFFNKKQSPYIFCGGSQVVEVKTGIS